MVQKPECKVYYTKDEIETLQKKRTIIQKNKYFKHRAKCNADKKKVFNTKNPIFANFFKEIKHGPIYPCISCNRVLPLRSVKEFKHGTIHWIKESKGKEEKVDVDINKKLHIKGVHYICTTCKSHLDKERMPPLCFKNGLQLAEIPWCFENIGDLGNQLLAKRLIFLKLRPLPKTGMKSMFDRVINIAIPDDDVIKTVTSLPRTPDNDGLINVKLKRKLEYKRIVNEEFVDRKTLLQCLEYLKQHHSGYSDITLSEPPEKKRKLSEDSNQLPETEFVQPNRKRKSSDDEEYQNELSEDESDEEESEKESEDEVENPYLASTCMQPEDPESNILINNSSKPMTKKRKLNSKTVYEVAPGENKVTF